MKKTAVVAAAFVLLACPSWAQSVGEKTGVNSLLDVAPKTTDFVTEAAQSDMFEIQSSQLAASKTQGDVQKFANQMVADHTKTTDELKALAPAANAPLPTAMDSSQQSMLDKLQGMNGEEFTKQYVSDQVSAHKTAVSLFERYAKGGEDEKLKSWATQTLPTLQHHLDMANGLNR
jgi:putative membrane protein